MSLLAAMKRRRRLVLRLVLAGIAVLMAVQVISPVTSRLLPALSPFLAVTSAVALRHGFLMFLLAIPVALLALFRMRWFCRFVCPTGTLAELAGKLNPGGQGRLRQVPRLGPWLILLALASAAAGYPLFLWLDPLSVFNGFVSAWRLPVTAASCLPAVGLLLIVVLSVWRPGAWCHRLCPLGFSQELLYRVARSRYRREVPDEDRREKAEGLMAFRGRIGRRLFLTGIFGVGAAVALRRSSARAAVLRPPGAVDKNRLGALCARCGNCMRACPQDIIRPDLGDGGIPNLLTPMLTFGPGYCSEECSVCTNVCPTGAIESLSVPQKQWLAIGTAEVSRDRCLSWNLGERCMVCAQYCPYKAIRAVRNRGLDCPEVMPELCRGCGLCQTICPAAEVAITVRAIPQRRLSAGASAPLR